jgi:hypothetical protein
MALFTVFMPLVAVSEKENDIQYIFKQTDSSYSFYGRFKIKADPNCLLEISFNYEDIRSLAANAKEVLLIDSGNNWNQISYTFHGYFFFENTSVWLRKLDMEKQRVDFTLVSSENNLSLMPRLISSSGYYMITQENECVVVEYYQECWLTEKSITKFYISRLKNEAIKFIYLFSEYAGENCGRSSSIIN